MARQDENFTSVEEEKTRWFKHLSANICYTLYVTWMVDCVQKYGIVSSLENGERKREIILLLLYIKLINLQPVVHFWKFLK